MVGVVQRLLLSVHVSLELTRLLFLAQALSLCWRLLERQGSKYQGNWVGLDIILTYRKRCLGGSGLFLFGVSGFKS